MDLETVLSFADSDSIISDSLTSRSRNTRGKTAVGTWQHARVALKGEEEFKGRNRLMYCLQCPDKSPYSTSVTTNFRRHLETKHGTRVVEDLTPLQSSIYEGFEQLYRQARELGRTTEIESQVFKNHLDQEKINSALAWLIVMRNLPYRIVESREFHLFISTLNPRATEYLPSAHSTIPKIICENFQSAKDIVRMKLQSSISKSTSLSIFGPRPIDCSFSRSALTSSITNFGITRRIGGVIGDNSTTNDTLCRALGAHLGEKEGISWDPVVYRLRCLGHVINLAVQAFLFHDYPDLTRCEQDDGEEELAGAQKRRAEFRRLGTLGKLHNLTVNIRSLSGRTSEFKKLASRQIPLDNRTRWNSWYQMLHVATMKEIASALDTYSKNHFDELSVDFLLPEGWNRLRTIEEILRPFSRATLATEGDNATLDKVLFTMDVLIRCFDEALGSHKSDPELSPRIQKGWEVFDKYYSKTDNSPYYAAALILHPNYRTTYIRANRKKKWRQPAFKQVRDLWLSYRDTNDCVLSYRPLDDTDDTSLDAFDRISRNLQNCTLRSSPDEYDDYVSCDPYSIAPVSALSWWLQDQQRKRWPKLSQMAVDILSMPAMSDEPERVFSGARRTISWERAQMGAEQIEKGECLKHWIKNSIMKGGTGTTM